MSKRFFGDYIISRNSSAAPFIKGGGITIDENTGKILSVAKITGRKKNIACTGGFKVLLVPGFINSHTHTDLTLCPDKTTPRLFSRWVLSVLEARKRQDFSEITVLRVKAFEEIVKSGTTLIGDIIGQDSFYDPSLIRKITGSIPRIKGFIELRGLDPLMAAGKADDFNAFYKNAEQLLDKNKNIFSLGLSPHSVYSVSEKLFRKIKKINEPLNLKTCIHVSEHASEAEFTSGRGGDIAVNLLGSLGLAGFSVPPKKYSTPMSYLEDMGVLDKNVSLIHCNEINNSDIELIKKSGASVIHCPRSNNFFKSGVLPLRKLLDEKVNVAIGTDSLYSNGSLSIIDEIKYAGKIHPEVSSAELFAMATVNGARALSFPGVTGTLEPGSFADFSAFMIGNDVHPEQNDIFDILFSLSEKDLLYVVINGSIVYGKNINNR